MSILRFTLDWSKLSVLFAKRLEGLIDRVVGDRRHRYGYGNRPIVIDLKCGKYLEGQGELERFPWTVFNILQDGLRQRMKIIFRYGVPPTPLDDPLSSVLKQIVPVALSDYAQGDLAWPEPRQLGFASILSGKLVYFLVDLLHRKFDCEISFAAIDL